MGVPTFYKIHKEYLQQMFKKTKVQNFRKPDAMCSFLLGVCEDLRAKPSPTSPSSNGLLELKDEVEEAIEEKKKK